MHTYVQIFVMYCRVHGSDFAGVFICILPFVCSFSATSLKIPVRDVKESVNRELQHRG